MNQTPWWTGMGVMVTPHTVQSASSGMRCHSNEGMAPPPDAADLDTM